jgi:hypothetical protein
LYLDRGLGLVPMNSTKLSAGFSALVSLRVMHLFGSIFASYSGKLERNSGAD